MTDAGIATKYTICTTCSTDKWCFSATKPISSKDLWISANLWMWSLSSFHIIFVYLSCIFICMEQINIYPWFLGFEHWSCHFWKNESWFTDCSKEMCQQTLSCSSLFYNFSDFDDNWGLTNELRWTLQIYE